MGSKKDRRHNARSPFNASIAYAATRRQRYRGARMTDCSNGGIQFVSELALRPGAKVVIRANDPSPFRSVRKTAPGCRAEIVWCNRFSDTDCSWYEVGAKFTEN